MFTRCPSVALKASASALCNNLTVLSLPDKQSITYGVVHKAFVCITNVTKGTVVNQKQVSCKGEGAHSSSAVLQVTELCVNGTIRIVIFSYGIEHLKSCNFRIARNFHASITKTKRFQETKSVLVDVGCI